MNILRYTLLLLSFLGGYVGWLSPAILDFLRFADEIHSQGEFPGIPGVDWVRDYTGVAFVDKVIDTYCLAFWPMIDGNSPAMVLQWVVLLGSMISGWVLFVLEACRTKPLAQVLPRLVIFGLVVPYSASSVAFSIYMACHLQPPDIMAHNSIDSNNSGKDRSHHNRRYPDATSRKSLLPSGLGSSTLFGFLFAAAPMFLPAPTVVSYKFKQLAFLLFFLGWPLCIAYVVWVMSLFRKYRPHGIVNRVDAFLSQPRSIYSLAIAFSAIPVTMVTLGSLASTMGFFGPQYIKDGYVNWGVFYPPPPWSTFTSTTDITYFLFQWDYVITCVAVFLWTLGLYIQTLRQEKLPINYTQLVLKILALTLLTGPPGTASVLMWERYEIINRLSLTLTEESKEE